jgi:hypothetical protein
MHKDRLLFFSFFLFFFCLSFPLCADVVYLKDGTIVEGKFVSDTTTGMYFEVERDGVVETVKFSYDEIETVDFTSTQEAAEKARQKKRKIAEKKERELQEKNDEEGKEGFIKGLEGFGAAEEEIDLEEVVEKAKRIARELGLAASEEGES